MQMSTNTLASQWKKRFTAMQQKKTEVMFEHFYKHIRFEDCRSSFGAGLPSAPL
jgi:hypothetical protein